MKTLLSSTLIILFAILSSSSFAQIGVRAGVNFNSVISRDPDGNEVYNDPKFNPGFHVGVTYDFPIAKDFYIQSAALLSRKGYRTKYNSKSISDKSRLNPYYIEMPINVLFAPKLGKGRILLGAGPYVAYGIGGSGKLHSNAVINDAITPQDRNVTLKFMQDVKSKKEGDYVYGKAFDYGVQVVEGYEYKGRLSVQVFGQLGLANAQPKINGEPSKNKLKNYGIGLSVGYIF